LGTPISSLEGWVEMLKDDKQNEKIAIEMSKDVERLKLVSIRSKNNLDEIQLISSYVYDETNPVFANELTAGEDHWGYYNGLNFGNPVDIFIGGGSKRVDPTKNQTGILKEIISATGSRTILNYETNTYSESPNGLVVNEAPLGPVTVSCVSSVDEDQYITYKDQIETSWVFADPDNWWFGTDPYEYPEPNCSLGYTFYNPNFSSGLNPESGADGIFIPSDNTDVDHPDNGSNMDLDGEEIAIVPIGDTRPVRRTFSVDQNQTIDLTGTIARYPYLDTDSKGNVYFVNMVNSNTLADLTCSLIKSNNGSSGSFVNTDYSISRFL
jgi:hypothetical protein